MEGYVKYPELVGLIAVRGIKKSAIAKRIGCSERAFRNKCCGKTSFTWEEILAMKIGFFPDVAIEDLMRTSR